MSATSPDSDDRANNVTVRLWAAARAAAGTPEVVVDHPGGSLSVAMVESEVVRRLDVDGRLARVLAICSVLVGEAPVGSRDRAGVEVPPGGSVEFLPPFAGG